MNSDSYVSSEDSSQMSVCQSTSSEVNGQTNGHHGSPSMQRRSPIKEDGGILRKDTEARRPANRVKKAVSFSSMPYEKKITSAFDCLCFMMRGTQMVKVKGNLRQYWRTFYLTSDATRIYWNPTSKRNGHASVPVRCIRGVIPGKRSEGLRSKDTAALPDELCFSILYGDQCTSLDLLCSCPEDVNIWVTGLVALLGRNSTGSLDLQSPSLLCTPSCREQWLYDRFNRALSPRDDSGSLSESDVITLLAELCPFLNRQRIAQRIKEFQATKVDEHYSIDAPMFAELYKEIAVRPEVSHLLIRFANKEYMTVDDFRSFLEMEQNQKSVSDDYTLSLVRIFEPSASSSLFPLLYTEGLEAFLMSDLCDIFDSKHKTVCQDMSLPLTHYFIAASHNTYLVEDQLKGPSSTDGYIQALLNGSRFLEMDVWDGPNDEPVIFHGHTLTSRIRFRDALTVVRDYAFEKSEYPLILCIENHLHRLEQQLIMVELIKSFLGPLLPDRPSDPVDPSMNMLPSPESLKRKIIILGRKLPECVPFEQTSAEVTEDDESAESIKLRTHERPNGSGSPKRIRLSREFSDLINVCRFQKFESFEHSFKHHESCDVPSVAECIASNLSLFCPADFVRHTDRFLTRVYPSGMRVDSSNMNPQDFHTCGCQIVAMNYQSVGPMMDLYLGRFSQNGGSGYVLKPTALREELPLYSTCARRALGLIPTRLTIKVISALNLPKPSGSTSKGDVVDPYVKLELYGIPIDCYEKRTKTIPNNGFNPVFEETFEFDVTFPEMALLRFAVLDDDSIGDDFIGQRTIPVDCMLSGYRHVKLLSLYGKPIPHCFLFVHVSKSKTWRPRAENHPSISDKVLHRRKPSEFFGRTGVRSVDEILRKTNAVVKEAIALKNSFDNSIEAFKTECGQLASSSLRQTMRSWLQRLSSGGVHLEFSIKDGYPEIHTDQSEGDAKLLSTFSHMIDVFRKVQDGSHRLQLALESNGKSLLQYKNEFFDQSRAEKTKKVLKRAEKFAADVRLIQGFVECLAETKELSNKSLKQICDSLNAYSES